MLTTAVTPAHGITLGPAATVITLVLLGWLLAGEAAWGSVSFRRFLAALGAGEAGARERFYRRWTAGLWLLALAVVLLAIFAPGFGLARLGFRWPDGFTLPGLATPSTTKGLLIGVVVAAAGGAVGAAVLASRKARSAPAPAKPAPPGAGKALAMLPRTGAERRGFAILSVTAGITEEIVWRGFLIAALVALLPPLPTLAIIAIVAIIFGFAHLYQGPGGVIATAVIGGLLAALYLATSSLLIPIVLHTLVDLRSMLIPVGPDPSPPSPAG